MEKMDFVYKVNKPSICSFLKFKSFLFLYFQHFSRSESALEMEKEETQILCELAHGSDLVPFPFPHSQTPIPPFSPSAECPS